MARKTKTTPEADSPLNGYPADYLACRTDRHQWGPAFWHAAGPNVSERIRECRVCASRVVWVIDRKRWARVGHATYRYAPGFLKPRSGLVRGDYVSAHLRNDFAAAQAEKRVD